MKGSNMHDYTFARMVIFAQKNMLLTKKKNYDKGWGLGVKVIVNKVFIRENLIK